MKQLLLIVSLSYISLLPGWAKDVCNDTINQQQQIKIKIKEKGENKPDVIIDGKKYDYAIFDLLDFSKVELVEILKEEQALKEYNSPNGAIVVHIKKKDKSEVAENIEPEVVGYAQNNCKTTALIIIDGEKSDKETLSKLKPEDIKSVVVYTDEDAISKYNSPSGAIIVKTKLGKK